MRLFSFYVQASEVGETHSLVPGTVRRLDLQCGMSRRTLHAATKLWKLRHYKTTVVQSLLPPDCEARIWYCRWFQESVFNGLLDPELTFYSDEA
jgi:hypothetical protein